jgi:predicted phosphate transport protein (TIGR00153 family)
MAKSFLSKLTPKEPKFFPLLKQMSDVLSTASGLLVVCMHSHNHDEAVECYKKIKEQEREGDRLSAKIFDELNSTFITPFDREDIHSLADRLDDVIDGINSSAKRVVLYNPRVIPASAVELAEILVKAAAEIATAVDELDVLKKNPTHIKQYCENLHIIEERGYEVYENYIMELFNEEKDAIEVVKLKEIAYEMESTIDMAERVGKIIKTIIVKYA